MTVEKVEKARELNIPKWALAIIPLVLLAGMVLVFVTADPLAFFTGAFPPLEELTFQRVLFPESNQIEMTVVNGGPDPVTIAQVLVDDAYWLYEITPGNTLDRLERG